MLPRITFACSVWYIPQDCPGEKTRRKKMLAALSALQKRALCVATGVFKTAAVAVLEVETFTYPIELQLPRQQPTQPSEFSGPWGRTETPEIRRTERQSPLQRLEATLRSELGIPHLNTIQEFVLTVVPHTYKLLQAPRWGYDWNGYDLLKDPSHPYKFTTAAFILKRK